MTVVLILFTVLLLDTNIDLLTSQSQADTPGSNDRILPKLDKKKKTISRSIDLIKQADLVISEFSTNNINLATTSSFSPTNKNKQPLLEIQYENEVGTGKKLLYSYKIYIKKNIG